MITGVGNSLQISCKLAGITRSTYYHKPVENQRNSEISERLKELATERPRFGSPRLTVLLRQEFVDINHQRVERLYRQEKLSLPRQRRKRKWLGLKQPLNRPEAAYERWSMDMMSYNF